MSEREDGPFTIAEFGDLLTNLDAQRQLYDRLVALSERERDAIGAQDLADLATIIAAKEQIVATAQQLERQRQQACERWARALDLATPPTLANLRQQASPGALAGQLAAVALALSDRVQRLRQLNTSNAQLIAQVQELARPQLERSTRRAHHPLYDQRGEPAPDLRPSILLDYRA